MSLTETLKDPERKARIVADAARVVQEEVASKSGFRGAALKAGFKAFMRIRPGIVPSAVESLLPAFAPAIDPFYERGKASGDVTRFFRDHDGAIADALLAVTDGKAEHAKSRVLVRIYRSLRGPARGYVITAVPRIAELAVRHGS